MINYCKYHWDKNKDALETALRTNEDLNFCDYIDLVKLVVIHIFNNGLEEKSFGIDTWDANNITVVDNGDYQGTLLFLIPRITYQPGEYDYLMTYVGYGSCSVCDTLQAIQSIRCLGDKKPTESQLSDYMILCKDIVANTIKPYNSGWREDIIYNECSFEEGEND